jgi:hypothetical protein
VMTSAGRKRKETGLLALQRLIAHLAHHGYKQTPTPCLFPYDSNGTVFTLVVDDFGIKYTTVAGANHLIATLKLLYDIKYFRDVTWHKERKRICGRVETNREPSVCASSPIDIYIVEELEGCNEMVGPGDGGILLPEVVDESTSPLLLH